MAKYTERVTRMMENFINEWQNGKNISEIARKYRVTPRTIYVRLQEIADKNGVQRAELLERPHKVHKKGYSAGADKVEMDIISPEEIREEVDELIAQTKLVIADICRYLEEED